MNINGANIQQTKSLFRGLSYTQAKEWLENLPIEEKTILGPYLKEEFSLEHTHLSQFDISQKTLNGILSQPVTASLRNNIPKPDRYYFQNNTIDITKTSSNRLTTDSSLMLKFAAGRIDIHDTYSTKLTEDQSHELQQLRKNAVVAESVALAAKAVSVGITLGSGSYNNLETAYTNISPTKGLLEDSILAFSGKSQEPYAIYFSIGLKAAAGFINPVSLANPAFIPSLVADGFSIFAIYNRKKHERKYKEFSKTNLKKNKKG